MARTTFEPQVYAAQSGRYGDDAAGDLADSVVRKPRKRKSPLYLKLLIAFGSLMILFSSGVLAAVYGLGNRYDSMATHQDMGLPAHHASMNGPLNYLVLGTDSRDMADNNGSRSDTMLIVHINKGLNSAFIVSIPRDAYVQVPAGKGWKGGMNKINAAFAYGGAALAVKTVSNLTNIQFDGAMVINFAGVVDMVNAVGGVHVCPPYDVKNYFTSDFPQYDKGWKAGQCYDMKGEEAEVFMRQRHDVPGGDFGRMKSQQLVMKAVAQKAESAGIISSPSKMDSLLSTVAKSLTIDKNMNLTDLAFNLKGISPSNLTFATVPAHAGTQPVGDLGDVDNLIPDQDKTLWDAINNDTTGDWLANNPQGDIATY